MGKKYPNITQKSQDFIQKQKIFFVATATKDSRINISPKDTKSLKIMDKNRVVWINLTGSGNETSAHIQQNSRMTIMFCSFEGDPKILRLYGNAKVIHHSDKEYETLVSLFDDTLGARQIFDFSVDLVQSSCGFGVPLFDYVADRDLLQNWAIKKGEDGIKEYWQKNTTSLDGCDTNILSLNRIKK